MSISRILSFAAIGSMTTVFLFASTAEAASIDLSTVFRTNSADAQDQEFVSGGPLSSEVSSQIANTFISDFDRFEINYDLRARGDFGNLGVFATVGAKSLPANLGQGTQRGSASASMRDTLEFSVASGIFAMEVDISGTELTPDIGAETNINVTALSGNDPSSVLYQRQQIRTLEGEVERDVEGALGKAVINFTIVDGVVPLRLSLFANVACSHDFDNCQATGDFFSSVLVTGGQVFDSGGGPLGNATVTSESGFDYLAGFQTVTAVPLPPALPAFGLMLLAFWRFARKRKASPVSA